MLLTKIWTAILAILATAFLGGMFLLAAANSGGFTESDERAIRAVAQAGTAALAADIQSSPVSLGQSLLADTRLKEALERSAETVEGAPPAEEADPLDQVFVQVANETLLSDFPVMSVALIDADRTIVAKTGIAAELFDELVSKPAFEDALKEDDDPVFSATLGGKLHAVKLSHKEVGTKARRVVAIQELDLGAGSFLRNVLGTSHPAGLVRDGQMVGDPIGSIEPSILVEVATKNMAEIPPDGVSRIFEVGQGKDTRIGAAGRVPGPAGKGNTGTLLVVVSQHTLGTTQRDLAAHLSSARASQGLSQRDMLLLVTLLVISLTLSFFLPRLEHTSPLRRLAGELQSVAKGTQAQVFHDTYGGVIGLVARSAAAAQEAVRMAAETETPIEEDEDAEDDGERPRTRRSTRNTRSVRRTRGSRGVKSASSNARHLVDAPADPSAVELSEAPDDASFEAHGGHGPVTEAIAGISESLAEELGGKAEARGPMKQPPPPPIPARTAGPGPDATPTLLPDTSDDPREAYYREIYDQFVETKKSCGESLAGFTYDKFAKKLQKNTEDLMARAGTQDVKFTVYVKDGKAALKAKVVKD